jgi:hypothetical protein
MSFFFLFLCASGCVVVGFLWWRGDTGKVGLTEYPSVAVRNSMLAISLAAPVAMVLATRLLPRTGDPMHPVDSAWYCALAAGVCLVALAIAGWGLTLAAKARAGGAVALAVLSVLINLAVGFIAFFLWSIRGMHT